MPVITNVYVCYVDVDVWMICYVDYYAIWTIVCDAWMIKKEIACNYLNFELCELELYFNVWYVYVCVWEKQCMIWTM